MSGATVVVSVLPPAASVSVEAGPSTYLIAAEAKFVALRDAIMACDYTGSGNIELPRGVEWPMLESSTLFVRHFYAPLVDSVFKRFEVPHLNYLVVGNPGIAKSAFGLYVLFRALREGRDVIFLAGKLKAGFHFRHNDDGGGSVRKFQLSDTLRVTSACSARDVLISDCWTPPLCDAFTILISSLQRERYQGVQKQPSWRTLFFPVFSKEEIDAMAYACFPQLLATPDGTAGIEERYRQWGGVPRYVLANVDDSQALLRDAIAAITVPRLKGSVGAEGIEAATSHRVVHIKTAGEVAAALPPDALISLRSDIVPVTVPRLQASISADGVNAAASHHVMTAADLTPATLRYNFPITTKLGSPFITEELYERLLHEQRTELFAFLDSSAGNPRLALLRGQVFEPAALEQLATGGTFRVRRLTRDNGSGDIVNVKLPPAVTARFDTAAALADAGNSGKLMHPVSKTYAAIDAVLPARLGVVNFTVSETHNIVVDSDKPDGLAAVAAALGWGAQGEVPFYWVVPDDAYENFKVGGFVAVARAGATIDATDVAARGKPKAAAGAAMAAAPPSAEAASAAAAASKSSLAAGPARRLLKATEVAAHPLASRVVQYVLRIPPFQRGGFLK